MNPSLMSRVLIPLDGSPTAEIILPQLRRFLPRHDCALTLLQALPLPLDASREEAERYLRSLAFQLTNEGYPAKYILRPGSAAEAILHAAATEQSTLVALATHGRSGVDRWVLGSVAESVLRSSPVPVLLARSFPSAMSRGSLERLPVRHFLLPLDGSPEALDALPPILDLAHGCDAQVRLLQITGPTPYPGHWESPDPAMKQADQILREACIPTLLEHRAGHPAEEILKCARENGIDLIVMTTHGRSGLPLWMLGSVTADVLRHTTVPLLAVRRHASAVEAGPGSAVRAENR